jgi:hypothetical protein
LADYALTPGHLTSLRSFIDECRGTPGTTRARISEGTVAS